MNSNLIYHVSFPYLNIHIDINPIAFNILNAQVYWYGIILATGFLLGCLYTIKYSEKFDISKDNIAGAILVSSISAIIGARLYYVIFYPGDFYIKNPLKMFMISEGGIAIYGAIIGGILSALIFAKIKNINMWNLLDIMSLGVLIGQSIGRWGNFVNQEAFGTPTTLPWAIMSENTMLKPVHPCFLYESLGCLIIFVILHFYSHKKKKTSPGNIFLLYMFLYGVLRALIEGLRTDSLIIPFTNLRISQVLAVIISLVSLAIILIKIRIEKENSLGRRFK